MFDKLFSDTEEPEEILPVVDSGRNAVVEDTVRVAKDQINLTMRAIQNFRAADGDKFGKYSQGWNWL